MDLRRNYGISEKEYDDLLQQQDNLCAICRTKSSKNLHVDHDHDTGKVRGLLCSNCNTSLGLLRENPALFLSAVEYLKKCIAG